MTSGIYKIINIITGDFYIGSTVNLDNRYNSHFRDLNSERHHNIKLQRAFNKYGAKWFIFHVIELCEKSRRLELEQLYIDSLKPFYNICKVTTSVMDGRKHSDETKEKLKGRIPWNIGIPRTENEKNLMSEVKKAKNKTRSPEYWDARSQMTKAWMKINGVPFKGKHHSEENKQRFRNKAIENNRNFICLETNEIFIAQIDASKKYNIRQGHISEILNGKRKSTRGYTFKYV